MAKYKYIPNLLSLLVASLIPTLVVILVIMMYDITLYITFQEKIPLVLLVIYLAAFMYTAAILAISHGIAYALRTSKNWWVIMLSGSIVGAITGFLLLFPNLLADQDAPHGTVMVVFSLLGILTGLLYSLVYRVCIEVSKNTSDTE